MDIYGPGYQGHAAGGIVSPAHLGLVAEADPEANIPLSNACGLGVSITIRRKKSLKLADRRPKGQKAYATTYSRGGCSV
jgi:hypothetical protein